MRRVRYAAPVLLLAAWSAAGMLAAPPGDAAAPRRLDPAAWGADHVGKALPMYVTGDECLFCHRKIGPRWPENRHQLTIRPAVLDEPALAALRELADGNDLAAGTRYLLGSRRLTRYLRRSKDYGKLDILSASFVPGRKPRIEHADAPRWDNRTFADRCAGCHATAVDARTGAFSAVSLDCFACHGDVPLEHTKDVSQVLLSGKSREPRQVISICGQCHLRGGRSKSSGRPYPNTFVAGDNLFRDFRVDWSDEAIAKLPAIERHIYANARDVAVFGKTMTCLDCHEVHAQSSEKHQALEDAAMCASCHVPGSDHTRLHDALLPANRPAAHSRVCDY